ncbi:glycoside hydrolase family 9 protein [Paenibacillus macerans]|uniref:glycoside hydrolase family 9 protein n=1 Tax=Paenibacillus macerans TaxID=44252 RepID=UPI00203B2377|nr:glycoside hydrolase family 9 protein [Paenibacillus macerans]MCM3700206.1 glycoside hydrolase family 9 protein [Paenibacillus macerans]
MMNKAKKARRQAWKNLIGKTALSGLVAFGGFPLLALPAATAADAEAYNYADALQKSLWFYDAEKSGPGITGGHLEWRGDSELSDMYVPLGVNGTAKNLTNLQDDFIAQNLSLLDPDGNGSVDLSGGFHDAGDHVKFGLPQSYTASTLGWSFYEFRDAFKQSGQEAHMLEELKWFSDYFLRSTFRNAEGEVVAFNYMVGQGTVDHTYWGPPELQDPAKYPRPATFATAEQPASDQAAGAAAALALMYLNTKDTDPTYAANCLDTATALYRFAQQHRGLGNSDGFYNSSYDEDELSWAAVWLYTATGDNTYIQDIVSVDASGKNTGYLKRIIPSQADSWQNIWTHSWDTVWGGVFVRLASLFPDNDQYDYFARWNLEYWSGGQVPHEEANDNTYLTTSPAGFGVLTTWGSARYNAAAQLCALVYDKYKDRPEFAAWAKSQMDYIMGDNPMGYSYIVGFPTPEESAKHPHHRAAHGSMTNNMEVPAEHRHVLWGALVGGPDATDMHKDVTTDYVYNEVAIDYNAGLVGALAGLYLEYGNGETATADSPPAEQGVTEYRVEGKIEQENDQRTQVTVTIHNESVHPPHTEGTMSARYYFNISELLAAGQSINDVTLETYYDEQKASYGGAVKVNGPYAVDAAAGIYYYELDWSGNEVYGSRDFQFGLIAKQDSQYKSHWDPANDWSRQGISATKGETTRIPLYLNGVKVAGEEPDGETPQEPQQPPGVPTGLAAKAGNAQVALNWNAANGAISYNVKRATVDGGPYTTVKSGITATNFTDAGLTNDTAYYYVVSAVNGAGESVDSEQISAIPQAGQGGQPGTLVLQYKAGDTNADDNQMKPLFRIINNGTDAVPLSELTIRYWYTVDGDKEQTFHFDWAQIGGGNLSGKTVKMAEAKENADSYVEISFNSGAGSLAPGSDSGEIQTRINKNDWTAYNEANDYSFDPIKTAYTDWDHVALYQNGTLVWGIEP